MSAGMREWYAVVDTASDMTVCASRTDAEDTARHHDQVLEQCAPHRAVTLVEKQTWMDVPEGVRTAVKCFVEMSKVAHTVHPLNAQRAEECVVWLDALPPLPEEPTPP